MRRPKVTITLEKDVLEEIDQERGMVPRSTWINEVLRKVIAREEVIV